MREEVVLWIRQAEADLRKARNDLITHDWDSAAFWSQQAAEKALKALLIYFGKVARSHNLLELARILMEEVGVDTSSILDDLRELTIHYTISRYPNAANALPIELYDEKMARDLVSRAERVVLWVKQYLH